MKTQENRRSSKLYHCKECGAESYQTTNHYGLTYGIGSFNECPKCPPFKRPTVWVCAEKPVSEKQWFDDYGNLIGEIPEDCVSDCSAQGSVDESVSYWVKKLGFTVPQERAAKWLREYGAWEDEELQDNEANARRVLWLACCDIKEQGEWLGLIH